MCVCVYTCMRYDVGRKEDAVSCTKYRRIHTHSNYCGGVSTMCTIRYVARERGSSCILYAHMPVQRFPSARFGKEGTQSPPFAMSTCVSSTSTCCRIAR